MPFLAYGFDLGEEWQDEVPWGDVEDTDGYPIDFDTWLANEAGLGYDTGATYEDRKKVWEACPVRESGSAPGYAHRHVPLPTLRLHGRGRDGGSPPRGALLVGVVGL